MEIFFVRRFSFVENPTSVDRRYCFSLCYFPVDKRQQIHQQFPFVRSERKKRTYIRGFTIQAFDSLPPFTMPFSTSYPGFMTSKKN